jgi:hypothetical protein
VWTRFRHFLTLLGSAVRNWRLEPPGPRKPSLRVLLDGEHIANLDWLYDNQPLHYYLMTALTDDRSKLAYALDQNIKREDELRVVLQSAETGGLMAECFFIANIWEDDVVTTREFGFFVQPRRETRVDDEVPGFGSWAEARALVKVAVDEDQRRSRQRRPRVEGIRRGAG